MEMKPCRMNDVDVLSRVEAIDIHYLDPQCRTLLIDQGEYSRGYMEHLH